MGCNAFKIQGSRTLQWFLFLIIVRNLKGDQIKNGAFIHDNIVGVSDKRLASELPIIVFDCNREQRELMNDLPT